MKRVAPLLLAVAAVACERERPPAGQIVLYVDTDAMVREPSGAASDPALLAPMIDRARFEVLRDGQPLPNSARDVAIDAAMLREGRVSFGIVPPPGLVTASVRVRLFRADRVFGPEPEPGVTLDTTVALPPVAEDGIVEQHVVLRTDDFGLRLGPIPSAPGRPARSLVGTWRGGRRVACAEGARPGEACVPGASFFFGNPQFRGRTTTSDISDERLVWVSPFFIDVTEVTVASFRAVWPELSGRVPEPTTKDADPYCTWRATADPDDDRRALACVSSATAEAYCAALDKTLPTEAQFELVTSGAGEEWAFPWGNDEPDCVTAVWGMAGIPTATFDAIKRGADQCRQIRTDEPGPLPPGLGLGDRISAGVVRSAGGADVQDLGGNLGEWVRDAWARPTDPFWSSLRPMIDPVNAVPNAADGDMRPVRGGDWASTALTTRAGFRRRRAASEQSPLIGFRCARPAVSP